MTKHHIQLTVNGEPHELDIDARRTLIQMRD